MIFVWRYAKKPAFTPNVPYTVSGKPEISLKFVKNDGVIVLAMEQVMTYFDMPGCVVVPLEEEYLSTTGLVQLKSTGNQFHYSKVYVFCERVAKANLPKKQELKRKKNKNFLRVRLSFVKRKTNPFILHGC